MIARIAVVVILFMSVSVADAKQKAIVYHNKALHDFYDRNTKNIKSEETVELIRDGEEIQFKSGSLFTIKNGVVEKANQEKLKINTKAYNFKNNKIQIIEYDKINKVPAKH
jgi:hypothetical protein